MMKIHNSALACTDVGLTCIRKAKSLASIAVVTKSRLYHIENSNRERGIRRKEKDMRTLALTNKFVECGL